MAIIDNFSLIEGQLEWNNSDEFYFAMVLKRKKENKELGSNSHIVKSYYIKSLEDLALNMEKKDAEKEEEQANREPLSSGH